MKREIIRVEPLSTYLERWKAPTSVVTRHGDTIYVSGLPPFDPVTGAVIEASIERQTELVLEQMKLCLETASLAPMFSVIFEVHPRPNQWDNYLGNAKMLRPELESVEGFVDNIRYRSLTREGWILSLSGWRDEKSVVRWRTRMRHHMVQEKGRSEILLDYHLRVGQITQDTRVPAGHVLAEQRLDETEVGEGTTVTLIDAKRPARWTETASAEDSSHYLGLVSDAAGLIGWDVFDAVLTPGDLMLLISWRRKEDAESFETRLDLPQGGRLRRVRVVRDYGMFDRREAPQYYPEVTRNDVGT